MVTTADADTKIETEFDNLDLNRDGKLDWSDYETLLGRYEQATGIGPEDRRLQALRGFYQLHYAELLRHAGVTSGELTKSQFVSAMRSLTADTTRINAAEAGGHLIFDLIDINGDGTISQDELSHYMTTVWKIDKSEGVYNLSVLDTDGDAQISRQEFVRGIQFHLDA